MPWRQVQYPNFIAAGSMNKSKTTIKLAIIAAASSGRREKRCGRRCCEMTAELMIIPNQAKPMTTGIFHNVGCNVPP